MQNNDYTIKTMTRQEVAMAIDWAAAEGWNPGLNDAECFHAADPNGFFVGLLGDEPIATLSAVKYGDSFGFLGFYIVKPEQRGKAYGIQLWNAGLAYLEGRTIGLDGVVAQQGNYQKSGFALAHRNVRYQGMGSGENCSADLADFLKCSTPIAKSPLTPILQRGGLVKSFSDTTLKFVALSTLPLSATEAYDLPFFPTGRREFLQCWIRQPQHVALCILQNDALAGYGVLRPCRSGYKIGPLFADTPELADRLFLALQSHATDTAPIFLDIPAMNPAAIALVERHGMVPIFETARMYKGKPLDLPLNRLFGVTSFELG